MFVSARWIEKHDSILVQKWPESFHSLFYILNSTAPCSKYQKHGRKTRHFRTRIEITIIITIIIITTMYTIIIILILSTTYYYTIIPYTYTYTRVLQSILDRKNRKSQ
jgi:hypothetical protein